MKLNKHGQTLIFFVILIPIIIVLFAIIVDIGQIVLKKTHMEEVFKTTLNDVIKNDSFDEGIIKKILIKNEINIDNLKIDIQNEKINLKNEINVESIFGKIIGIEDYQVKVDITGYLDGKNIKFQ